MGYANDPLLRDCEAARKRGDISSWKTLAEDVLDSQKACAHPEADRKKALVGSSERKPFEMTWCARCSKVFR